MSFSGTDRPLATEVEKRKKAASRLMGLTRYRNDPIGYCRDILRVSLTPDQEAIAGKAANLPCRILAPSGHEVGKSFLGAALISWRYDCFKPGVCLTTAPTDRQVRDILWKEVRKLRNRVNLGGFIGPKMPRLEDAPDHFAHGFTARDATGFQGQHEADVTVIFDEAEGVAPEFWEAADTMLGSKGLFIAFYNPTMQSGPTADAERQKGYHVHNCSCLNHPNIAAELAGKSPPFPAAVRLATVRGWCEKWATRLALHEPKQVGDFQLGGEWFRPTPVGEARILGRRPTSAYNAVFPVAAFNRMEQTRLPEGGVLQIGCDVARYGDDDTCWHVRRGGRSLYHEGVNGWDIPSVTARCQALAIEWGKKCGIDPKRVLIAVDDSGVGGGVTDLGRVSGYAFVGVNSASASPEPEEYPNLRSAMWFGLADAATQGLVTVADLPEHVRQALRRELTAPVYSLDIRARRCVEPKDATKVRIGRSPDNADAMLLAYANLRMVQEQVAGRVSVPS